MRGSYATSTFWSRRNSRDGGQAALSFHVPYDGGSSLGEAFVARAKVFTLTPTTVLGLFFIQRYRFLTIVSRPH